MADNEGGDEWEEEEEADQDEDEPMISNTFARVAGTDSPRKQEDSATGKSKYIEVMSLMRLWSQNQTQKTMMPHYHLSH